jgi:hypothetical protein
LLDDGLARAKKEGKRVLLEFGSDLCAPCRRFDEYYKDPDVSRVIGLHLVRVKVNGSRNSGVTELMQKFGDPEGIPAWWVLDADGKAVDGASDVGFPMRYDERAGYLKALRGGCPKLGVADAEVLERKLREHPLSDESRAARNVERAADAKLTFAKELLRDGKRDKAKTRLETIVKDCRGTKAADEAARMLNDLRP